MAFSSNTMQNYEQLSYSGPNLSIHRAKANQIISDAVSTRTLLAKESGATCLFDVASGVVYTLPTPVAGMEFEFVTTTTITSNAAKVITNSASVFILGAVEIATIATATVGGFSFDGSTHRAISSNGTTTGGIIGSRYKLKALSSTVWAIEGILIGSGTVATPAATS